MTAGTPGHRPRPLGQRDLEDLLARMKPAQREAFLEAVAERKQRRNQRPGTVVGAGSACDPDWKHPLTGGPFVHTPTSRDAHRSAAIGFAGLSAICAAAAPAAALADYNGVAKVAALWLLGTGAITSAREALASHRSMRAMDARGLGDN